MLATILIDKSQKNIDDNPEDSLGPELDVLREFEQQRQLISGNDFWKTTSDSSRDRYFD